MKPRERRVTVLRKWAIKTGLGYPYAIVTVYFSTDKGRKALAAAKGAKK